MGESNIQSVSFEEYNTLKEIVFLLKDITMRFKYSLDTYFVCLSLLSRINSKIPENRLRLMVAGLVLLSGKVHEYRTPRFMDMIRWGGEHFSNEDLIMA